MDQYSQVTSTKFDATAEFWSNSPSTYILSTGLLYAARNIQVNLLFQRSIIFHSNWGDGVLKWHINSHTLKIIMSK